MPILVAIWRFRGISQFIFVNLSTTLWQFRIKSLSSSTGGINEMFAVCVVCIAALCSTVIACNDFIIGIIYV